MHSLFLLSLALCSLACSFAASEPDACSAKRTSHKSLALSFYYLWYGNPEHDGQYLHWNHEVVGETSKTRKEQNFILA